MGIHDFTRRTCAGLVRIPRVPCPDCSQDIHQHVGFRVHPTMDVSTERGWPLHRSARAGDPPN